MAMIPAGQVRLSHVWPAKKRAVETPPYPNIGHTLRLDCTSTPCNPNPFDSLPIEINQRIAEYIDDDRDLFSFRATCSSTAAAIEADRHSFWRRRFYLHYDAPAWGQGMRDNTQFRDIYKRRQRALRAMRMDDFDLGQSDREKACLQVLRDMIIDAYGRRANSRGTREPSKNLIILRHFAVTSNLLEILGKSVSYTSASRQRRFDLPHFPSDLLLTIQVLFAPDVLSFHPRVLNAINDFPTTQQFVYGIAVKYPIFLGLSGATINMEFVARNLHFWKYHMTSKDESLYPAFQALQDEHRPRYWSSQLSAGIRSLGRKWKGSYTFVDRPDLWRIRSGQGHDEPIQDLVNGELELEAFQDLELVLYEDSQDDEDESSNRSNQATVDDLPSKCNSKGAIVWPEIFEHYLPSRTTRERRGIRTRSQQQQLDAEEASIPPQRAGPISFRFDGTGEDNYEAFLASGWLTVLPSQSGIPGWQRMVMMKYFEDEDTGDIDYEALWAYEGVVLPGGEMVIGRWWSPTDGIGERMYSGPFIMWCVD